MSSFVNVVIPPLRAPLTYGVPLEFADDVPVGSRVLVPLGSRSATGFVIGNNDAEGLTSLPDVKDIKSIEKPLNPDPCFTASQLLFFQWVANYYGDPLSNVIDVAIPPAVPQRFNRRVKLLLPDDLPKGKLQREIISCLKEEGGALDAQLLSRRFKGASAALKGLCERGVVEISSEEIVDEHLRSVEIPSWAKNEVSLNESQKQALSAITAACAAGEPHTFLLHGATGSGKTEVYIEAIQKVLAAGRGALVIVPEIALTPQLVDRFRARLGNQIAVLHSGLHKRVRWDSWRALLQGRNRVAIGARSAVFAPVPDLGLIIVDEEHDGSYKQSDGLRYHARDLAIVRGQMEKCPVILGSATPSLETYANCAKKRHTYIPLPLRHGSAPPLSFEIVDLNKTKPWEMPSKNISPLLFSELSGTMSRGEQAFILYNRRGFASYLQCDKCDAVVKCPNCSVTLTYHQFNNALCCHYCNLSLPPPQFCRECGTGPGEKPGTLTMRGAGTERILEEVQGLFPEVAIERLDRDAAQDIETYRAILNRVRSGETRILVGTQMIAKGHDLPEVTLVGIVDCDVGLHMPDFRAAERVFQLLTQSAGRAGRGDKPGRVILQTRVPQHPALLFTVSKDFKGFARQELQSRKDLNYPPFSRLLRIVASSSDEQLPINALSRLADVARSFSESANDPEMRVLGPAPAPLSRLKTEWRAHLLVKAKSPTTLIRVMNLLRSKTPRSKHLKITFDLDPQEML